MAWRPASDVSLEPGRGGEAKERHGAGAGAGARPGGRRGGGAAAELAGCGCPGARDSRCVTEQMPAVARSSRLLLTHQKAVRVPGGFGAPGAGKPLRKSWGAGEQCSGELHGWQLPEPPAARLLRAIETERDRQETEEPFLGVHWLGWYPRSLMFAPVFRLEGLLGKSRASTTARGLESFLPDLTLTLALSREATLRLWTPLAGSKPGSRSFLSMADRKALWHSGNAARGQRILRKGCGSGEIVCLVSTLS